MKLTAKQVAIGIKEYVIMTLGMFMYAFGWVACVIPAGGMGGGATGLSMLLNAVFPSITMGTFVFAINVVLLIVAGFIVGWNFGIKTIYCIIVLSIAMDSWGYILPPNILVEYTQNIDSHNILLVILGAVIAGSGVAVCFSQGGSTGGTDIVAMIINKYKPISYGRIIFVVDLLIIASSLLVGFSIDAAIYGYIMTLVFGYTADMVLAGNKQSSQVFIISQRYEEIIQVVNFELKRGATLIESEGSFTHNHTKMIMVVCTNRDTPSILKAVKQIDPDAFITVASVMGVYGQGFQPIKL